MLLLLIQIDCKCEITAHMFFFTLYIQSQEEVAQGKVQHIGLYISINSEWEYKGPVNTLIIKLVL